MKFAKQTVTLKSFSALSFDQLEVRPAASSAPAEAAPKPAPATPKAQEFRVHPLQADRANLRAKGDHLALRAPALSPMTAPASVLLLVQDEGHRSLLATALTQAGYAVETAAPNAEALRWLDPAEADVIVLHLDTPGDEGWEALDRLMRLQPKSVILPLTARWRSVAEASNTAPALLLPWPVSAPKLLHAIRVVLTESGEARGNRWTQLQNFARFARPYTHVAPSTGWAQHWGIND